ncbi:MAG: hypothetical protein JOZ64_19305, partial [Solirubrobacterales bacterium]|nr:hypothetical protein [Solirubrobacterales bacterium]
MLPQDSERYVVVTDGAYGDEHLRIVDTQAADPSQPIVANVDYERTSSDARAPALFYGLALTADGSRIYVSDGGYDPSTDPDRHKHYNLVELFDLAGSPPQLVPRA